MPRACRLCAILPLVLAGMLHAAEPAPDAVDFNRSIRPILSNNCFKCHGPDAAERQSGLRLDQREAALAPAESGETAIVPGKSAASELWKRISSTDDELRMPPADSNKKLSAFEKELLRKWLDQGAPYQSHWSFVAPVRAGQGQLDRFEARLDGEVLKGKVTYPDGQLHHFEGRQAPLLLDKKAPVWGEPVTLFDGKTLNGWKLRDTKKKNGWAVVGGELAVVETKDNADFVTEQAFQDMKLHLEFNVEPKSNSGVYLRGRYEVQILDNPDAKMALDSHGCGGLYSRIAPSLDATKPAGEWQTYDITFVGRQLKVVLNGKEIVNGIVEGITGGALSPFEGEPGPLMLQGDHGKVRFRNIVLTPAR